MRKLDKDFEDKFNNDFKFVIDYVKNDESVFLGVRKNLVDLYVNGGCFFTIEKTSKSFKGKFNIKGYGNYLNNYSSTTYLKVKNISNKILDNTTIDEWKNVMDDLKKAVATYREEHYRQGTTKNAVDREKILQQKLALAFNNSDSEYYTYDIEYNIEGLKEYVFDVDTEIIAREIKAQELGRIDNMVIEIKNNKKVNIYLMEVKEGLNSIKTMDKQTKLYGQGLIGHVNSYMKIIDKVKKNEEFFSNYLFYKGKKAKFNFREILMEDVKSVMSFYKKFDLIKNPNFKNIDYDNLEFGDIELVFYLGGYNMNSKKLENHLGLNNNQADSVKNLINRDYNMMKYDYISKNQIYDFKYHKDIKEYAQKLTLEDLDIKNYNQVKVRNINNKIEFYE